MNKIATSEKIWFWIKWSGIVLLQGIVAILGTGVIGLLLILSDIIFNNFEGWSYWYLFSIPLFPIAYFIRHSLNTEKGNPLWWWLNYTEDSDWGLVYYKEIPPKKTFWNAIKWYLRNSAWNFKILFKPKWRSGEVDIFESVKYTLPPGHNRFTRANKDTGIYGINHCYYVIDGSTYGRYSFAQPKGFVRELNIGVSGNRYLCKLKF